MFFVFYISSITIRNFTELKDFIIKAIPSAELNIPQMIQKSQVIKNTDELIEIWCDYFSLSISNGGKPTEIRGKDYGMNFDFQFWFDIYTQDSAWVKHLVSFIGEIMKAYSGDCVLEANGEKPIIMRKENIITVDDSKLNGTQRFPFHYLGMEFTEGSLEMV